MNCWHQFWMLTMEILNHYSYSLDSYHNKHGMSNLTCNQVPERWNYKLTPLLWHGWTLPPSHPPNMGPGTSTMPFQDLTSYCWGIPQHSFVKVCDIFNRTSWTSKLHYVFRNMSIMWALLYNITRVHILPCLFWNWNESFVIKIYSVVRHVTCLMSHA